MYSSVAAGLQRIGRFVWFTVHTGEVSPWMLQGLSRNSSRFMNENQVFASHSIQISVLLWVCRAHEIAVFTFNVFNHSSPNSSLRTGHLYLRRGVTCWFSGSAFYPDLLALVLDQSLINRSHFNLAESSRPLQAIPLDMMSFDDPLRPSRTIDPNSALNQ